MSPRVSTAKAKRLSSQLQSLTADYKPLPDIPDEFVSPDGRPRPHWQRFFEALFENGVEDVERRFGTADRHVREAGVSYRAYGDASERTWPISHLPLLIEAREWREIAEGVAQRAQLLEAIAGDIYGQGRLVSDGDLPAAVVTGSPEFLHSLHRVQPPGGKFLHLYAADLGRGPDGRWWVLGDRTQAPSGTGYALANRLVLSRAFQTLYGDMNVERLAPFFQNFKSGLATLAQRSDARICLLTPGPYAETYFEQAYLARYLGFLLVEGADLTMRGGQVHVRTVAGLQRADVIWRRIDSDYADPLELNAHSRLGVPGLIEAVRDSGVVVANALGTGVLETPALMSFMPRLCQRLLGEALLLPNIATWWCGQPHERQDVMAHLDEMAIAGAFGNPVLDFPANQSVVGASLTDEQKKKLIANINARGIDFVGQEVVNLSTTPTWIDGHLTPRPFVLRVYATQTPEGWKVMPGGFCRISDRSDARAVSMGSGVKSADVWVLAEKPVEMVTLLPTDETVRIRRIMGILPSRAADNLFWLGRYLERAEATLRLIRSLAGRLTEADPRISDGGRTAGRLASLFVAWGAAPPKPGQQDGTALDTIGLAAVALHSESQYGSVLSLIREARRAASFIRERLSPDTWRLINQLDAGLAKHEGNSLTEMEIFESADVALRRLAAIAGLGQENMNRGAGWHFFDAGRRIERAIDTCRFARHFAGREAPADDLDALLDLVDSQITYRSRYLMGVAVSTVRDMVVLDPFNPRSVAFQVERLVEHLRELPVLNEDGMLETPRRLVLALAAEISTSLASALDTDRILGFEQNLLGLAEAIAQRYFLQGPHAERADNSSGLA
jgi:uncharacterized circularly permuted ATP-grasp superfamily protein/uncharacterized alpha-E superfamily protein